MSISKKRRFTSSSFVNCAFYSAIACVHPFLSTHLSELGLSWSQCCWINSISALVSMLGPLSLGPIAHKLSGYKQTLVVALLIAFMSGTALLFVPGVISTEHQPKMYFDCSEGVFRIEQCPNWNGECHIHPKRPAINFSSFELVTCSYLCDKPQQVNSSWYPVNVCFQSENEESGSLCLDVPREKIIPTDASLSRDDSIQFDSRFDRWPLLESPTVDESIENLFDGRKTCTFKPAPPLLISQKLFDTIQCRPMMTNCRIHCSVNLKHRTNSVTGTRVRQPTPCYMEQGNRRQTLYLYLLFRCLLDLSLLTSHTLLEALRVANTNNFDSIYSGTERFWTLCFPFILWPPLTGIISDYFNEIDAPKYSPQIVIFDGFIAIAAFLIIMLPLNNNSTKNHDGTSGPQRSQLQPTTFRYPRIHSSRYLAYRMSLFVPLVLVLGSLWGVTDTIVRPFYQAALHASNFLLGLATSSTFLVGSFFIYMSGAVISGVGRMHLLILAFVFYALRCAGISFLVGTSRRFMLIPFEMMTAFCLPLAWIAITAYGQHMIKRSPNALSYATGTTIFQPFSPHVIMQYTLGLMHFGGGRALGSAFGSIWLSTWPDVYPQWLWLTNLNQTSIDNYAIESIVSEVNAARNMLKLLALFSLACALLFFVLYHSCCVNWLFPKNSKYDTDDTNGQYSVAGPGKKHSNCEYSKLRARSENEVYPLKSASGKTGSNSRLSETTRSMVTLREPVKELETSVDDEEWTARHKF